jgi:exodeoxyribonuclease V alpha subunit
MYVMPRPSLARWWYTGITRAREQFTLIEAQAGLLEAAIARPSVRASGLRHWWGQLA